ncbi:ATP-binding protein [Sphaerisporangium siamense]
MRTGSLLGVTHLVGSREAPKAARDYVRATLGKDHPALDDVTLLASELVTNSSLHSDSRAGGRITLALADCGDLIHVDVTDAGGENFPRMFNDPLAESGRGLRIVRSTAQQWGICDARTERTIWFEVPYKRLPQRTLACPRQRPSPDAGFSYGSAMRETVQRARRTLRESVTQDRAQRRPQ